jgi:hypothetical protein
MKRSTKIISITLALTMAILFVSGQNENHITVKKTLNKIQPSLERQMVIENNMVSAAVNGVR